MMKLKRNIFDHLSNDMKKEIINVKLTYINRYLGIQINKDDQSSKLLDKLETKLLALQAYHKLNFPS
jgi:phenylalanyl-tRNA synthetase beta subunit